MHSSAGDSDYIGYLFLADAVAMRDLEQPLLAAGLSWEPGRTFRVPLRWYANTSPTGRSETWSFVGSRVGRLQPPARACQCICCSTTPNWRNVTATCLATYGAVNRPNVFCRWISAQ